jgi:hypothetical protein
MSSWIAEHNVSPLLETLLTEFDQYLAICVPFKVLEAISTSEGLGSGTINLAVYVSSFLTSLTPCHASAAFPECCGNPPADQGLLSRGKIIYGSVCLLFLLFVFLTFPLFDPEISAILTYCIVYIISVYLAWVL